MIVIALSALLPVALGLTIACLVSPRNSSWLLLGALGVGVGYGVSSWLVFLCLVIIGRPSRGLVVLEVLLMTGGAVLAYRRRRDSGEMAARPGQRLNRVLVVAIWTSFVVVLAAAVATFILSTRMAPYGAFDAWESWNKKARFIFLASSHWRQLFTAVTDIVPDYPLFLPLAIAGILINAGRDSVVVPAIVAGLFLLGATGLIVSVLSQTRSRTQSLLAAMALLGTPFFVHLSSAQYADIPLSYLFLATLALLLLHDSSERPQSGLMILAGLMAGLSGWMKNEGLLFLAAVTVTYFGFGLLSNGWSKTSRLLLRFASGAALPLAATVYFKARFAGTNAILQREGWHTILHKLLTHHRYHIVLDGFYYHIAHLGVWPESILVLLAAYGVVFGFRVRRQERVALAASGATLMIMLGFYFLVFVASPFDTPPFDIPWYILVTLDRLLMQLWPGFLLLYFSMVKTPEEATVGGRGSGASDLREGVKTLKDLTAETLRTLRTLRMRRENRDSV